MEDTLRAMRLPLLLAFISVIPVAVQLLGKSILMWGLCVPFCLESCAHLEEELSVLSFLCFYLTGIEPTSGLDLASRVGVELEPVDAAALPC